MTSQTGTRKITINILPDISKSKDNWSIFEAIDYGCWNVAKIEIFIVCFIFMLYKVSFWLYISYLCYIKFHFNYIFYIYVICFIIYLYKVLFWLHISYLFYMFYYIFIIYSYVHYMFFNFVIYFFFHIIWFQICVITFLFSLYVQNCYNVKFLL